MPKSRHFGAGSDTMQQVHGAGVKSNLSDRKKNIFVKGWYTKRIIICYNRRWQRSWYTLTSMSQLCCDSNQCYSIWERDRA